ncbi:MAG: type pullulanase [Actinomycetota bacterium]
MSRFISLKFVASLFTTIALLAGASFASGSAQAAGLPSTINLTVHYNRGDADYSSWKIYTWKNYDSATADVNNGRTAVSTTDSFGGVYVVNATGMTNFDSLGFLITQGDSWTKDFPSDRFITSFTNGNAEIWLKSGDATIYTSEPAPPAPGIASAALIGFKSFHVIVSPAIAVTNTSTEGFTINDGTSDVPVTSATATNAASGLATGFDLSVANNVDLAKTYTVSHADLTSKVASTAGLFDSQAFTDAFTYAGNDLGNTYTSASTSFRVWAPTATAVSLMLHSNSSEERSSGAEVAMTQSIKGTWVATLDGDRDGLIYDYKVQVDGKTNYASDPYARASTIDSGHSVVVDLDKSNPTGWASTSSPDFGNGNTDAIIYELQVRDLSSNANSNIPVDHRKKYLGLTDVNTSFSQTISTRKLVGYKYVTTTNTYKTPTGVAAIKALGVTHVELLPVYDFNNKGEGSADENHAVFNWGYDPVNYNVPDGGFSSDAANPYARITELKSGIQSLHQQGLRTIMDVVYNHVSDAATFSEELIVPGYFFRHDSSGGLTSASGCGNDVNSERSMVSKFIVDSVTYWASEYHFDGFRFDLMGLLDVTTMNNIRTSLNTIDPNIVMIGEGWNMGTATHPANQNAAAQMPNIGFFNDQIRDATKGSVFGASQPGYVQGNTETVDGVIAGITAQTNFGGRTSANWLASTPGQSVNYVEAHDNLTLFDKLTASLPSTNRAAAIVAASRQSAAIVLTAQGVPFMQAGQEFLRTKGGNDNSYASSDSVNGLNWLARAKNASTVEYYKGLIAMRKAHPAFRMATAAAINSNLTVSATAKNTITMKLNGKAVGDTWKTIVVLHNPNASAVTLKLPAKANWLVSVNGTSAGTKTLKTLKGAKSVVVPAKTSMVLHY